MKTTAERLREIMEERGLKQADIIELAKPFSEKYGVKLTRPDMSQYCSGKVKPTQGKLFLLAAALDVDEAWLMGYNVDRERKRQGRFSDHIAALESGEEMRQQYMRLMSYAERIYAAYHAASPDTQAAVRAILHIEEDPDGDR